ncbi:MAG: formylglycine-generating enzyme family protein [Candidatus Kapaibacteriales bacterium]
MFSKGFNLLSFLALLAFLSLNSCGENSVSTSKQRRLLKIEPDEIHPFDVVTIYGENLGVDYDSVAFYIDSTIFKPKIIKWNNNFIRFEVSKDIRTGKLFLIYSSKDTTNALLFNGFPFPKIEFVEIPSGSFLMGSETGLAYEKPLHKVVISNPFFISIYEITQKQWRTVMDSNPSLYLDFKLPISNISWDDAIIFCNKLSKMFGFDTCYQIINKDVIWDTSCNGFRLPTEAEWEYSCRAGTTGDFAGTGNPIDMGWYDINSGGKAQPVGRKLPNQFGIFDMHGNVLEWCWDWFDPFYYSKSPEINPIGPEVGNNRVIRGGSWQLGSVFARSSSRQFPDKQKFNIGFRIVRTKR